MNTTTITVGSITYAMKLRKQLLRIGVSSELIKVDSSKTKNGCSYGIRLQSSKVYDAVSILKKYGIEYSVYTSL